MPPPMATDVEQLALVGRQIMHGFDTSNLQGWYQGRISARGVSQRDLKATPTANFVVTYDTRVTKTKRLHGRVASTLTAANYGKKEWWLLLERVEMSNTNAS